MIFKNKKRTLVALNWLVCLLGPVHVAAQSTDQHNPKIVNIVNFIRLLEPRDPKITQELLYKTVVSQINLMESHKLKGSFLLQYDALMDEGYQALLRSLSSEQYEIGAWWEIPQPLVEKAGLKWRGRYPWDWHANVGFSTGYTPAEREKLVDVFMEDFKSIFGYYPKSVASWFIDAHTLNYLYEKYHIVASANCKDQYGTDGYTLWGGYWNQAYYPSKINSYMPAQTTENQTPVPIFRMLGSDPVRQYDAGVGGNGQEVITLEPACSSGGGNKGWVDWFFREFIEGESMEFSYTQVGQENSFTWDAMAKGLENQFSVIAKLRDVGKLEVQTLAESGEWFKERYKLTPTTSVTINEDLEDSDVKTVWLNSRFYRANIFWEADGTLRFRDVHLFREDFPSVFTTEAATTNECQFFTLPVVDGYLWSDDHELAGLRLKAMVNNQKVSIKGGTPDIKSLKRDELEIVWPLTNVEGTIVMALTADGINVSLTGNKKLDWFFELEAPKQERLPFAKIGKKEIGCIFEGYQYAVQAHEGSFSASAENSVAFRIYPRKHAIRLNMAISTEK